MVSAATGALLIPHVGSARGRLTLLLACYAMFGISLFASVIIIAQVWSRLALTATEFFDAQKVAVLAPYRSFPLAGLLQQVTPRDRAVLRGGEAVVRRVGVDGIVDALDETAPDGHARQRRRPEGSYTVELLEDPRLAGDKVREEAAEVVKAVSSESEERVAEEGADVVYHLAVLLLSRGLSMAEVLHVLNGRRRSG